MDILGKLFGTPARVKLLRLFLFNPEGVFSSADVVRRARITAPSVRRELAMFKSIGFVKKRSFFQEVTIKRGKKKVTKKKRVDGWTLDSTFRYLASLERFLLDTVPIPNKDLLKRLRGTGTLRLVIVSGVFIKKWDSRIDLLVVADGVRRGPLESIIKSIEAEIGRELRFAVLSTHDFKYRLSVYDRLVRDILDFPHETLLDKIGVYSGEPSD